MRDLTRHDHAGIVEYPRRKRLVRIHDFDRLPDRCKWVAQFMREHRQELILATIRIQHLQLVKLSCRDVARYAGKPIRLARRITDGKRPFPDPTYRFVGP